MTGNAVKASAVVGAGGKVELVVPLPPGTAVEVFVYAPTGDDCRDLLAAAGSSMGFWDNPADDAAWEAVDPGESHHEARAEEFVLTERVGKLLEAIMDLSFDERREIAERVCDSLDATEIGNAMMDDPAFRAEFERRLDEVEKHPERLIDADVAIETCRAELAARRAARNADAGHKPEAGP